jgi:hypothetical protein
MDEFFMTFCQDLIVTRRTKKLSAKPLHADLPPWVYGEVKNARGSRDWTAMHFLFFGGLEAGKGILQGFSQDFSYRFTTICRQFAQSFSRIGATA